MDGKQTGGQSRPNAADAAAKRALRSTMRQQRDGLSAGERARRSRAVCAALAGLPDLTSATVVAGFVATRSEVDPAAALAEARARGAIVVLPRVRDDAHPRLRFHRVAHEGELGAGAFGVAEPPNDAPEVPASAIELVVVPGLAFDRGGGRLGYGGGYYDELLATIAPLRHARLVGVAFDVQVVPRCPMGPSDVPVDVVVTETAIVHRRDGVAARGGA